MNLFLFLILAVQNFDSVPLPNNDTLPQEIQETLAKEPPLNAYRMLANIPGSFEPYMALAKSIFNGKLDPKVREIAILRSAKDMNSSYLWYEHVFIGKASGLTDNQIAAIMKEISVKSLGDEGNFICKVADELTRNSDLTDPTFHELFNRYSVEEGCELIFAIGIANAMGRFVNGTRVQIEKK